MRSTLVPEVVKSRERLDRHLGPDINDMPAPNHPSTGERLQHAMWVEEAVRLALKHWSARRIARKLGLHHSTVADALAKELASHRLNPEQVEAYRNQQRETIFRLLSKWEPRARGNQNKGIAPDKDAALVHLKYLERWAKLDGLDAPTRNEHTGAEGGPLVINVSSLNDEQLRLGADDSSDAPSVEGGVPSGVGEASEKV